MVKFLTSNLPISKHQPIRDDEEELAEEQKCC